MPTGEKTWVKRHGKRIVCVSWVPQLALTRSMMLRDAGYSVTSLVGPAGLEECCPDADLMVLAHSVPAEGKLEAIKRFRQVSSAPVLSLLRPNQEKLPEADFGVEAFSPDEFLAAVERII